MNRSLLFLVAAGFLAGCTAPSTSSGKTSARDRAVGAPAGYDRLERLNQGMSAEAVVALFGQPDERRPHRTFVAKTGEVWTYREVVGTEERPMPISTREVPYFDPFSGMQKTIQEPVYTMETIRTVRILNLVLLDGTLDEWTVHQETRRTVL